MSQKIYDTLKRLGSRNSSITSFKSNDSIRSDNPEGKKGHLIVMRHSIRADTVGDCKFDEMQERPYDSPIVDFELPAQAAQQLLDKQLDVDVIITSPYKRCLQTTGVICKELNIKTVIVNYEVGELGFAVRSCQQRVWQGRKPANGKVVYLSQKVSSTILNEVSGGVVLEVEKSEGNVPFFGESIAGGRRRMSVALRKIFRDRCKKQGLNVLVVAHGDTVDAASNEFGKRTCYNVPECSWVAVAEDENKQFELLHAERVKFMETDNEP